MAEVKVLEGAEGEGAEFLYAEQNVSDYADSVSIPADNSASAIRDNEARLLDSIDKKFERDNNLQCLRIAASEQ